MNILITGYNGFIGKNLSAWLKPFKKYKMFFFGREHNYTQLKKLVYKADFIFHLAGENRPKNEVLYKVGNTELTQKLCSFIKQSNKRIPIVFTSSKQANRKNAYGLSKLEAEKIIINLNKTSGNPIKIFRLPNVFGKWCKPNYNSVVATFCHNIISNKPVKINDPKTILTLLYVDDLMKIFMSLLHKNQFKRNFGEIESVNKITLKTLSEKLYEFKDSRKNLMISDVGTGIDRALYSTFISYLQPKHFNYTLKIHSDNRGSFVEMIKTKSAGQVSFFTAKPGVTRGEHYHHTKTEKFLVVSGNAKFKFRNINTDEYHEIDVSDRRPSIVDTIPGWTHDITNSGDSILIVLLWANEVFDQNNPDTNYEKVVQDG